MIPDTEAELIHFANEMVEQCRVSVGSRAAYCRLMNAIAETGRYDGTKSLINLLYTHLTRTAAHLFSPVELRFKLDFERKYPKNIYEQAAVVAEVLTRQWDRNSTDILFGRGVFESLKYGACILKQWVQTEGPDDHPAYYAKLVMPWQFGVYNEAENNINMQTALCETQTLTLPEVWRRIYHLPNARKLFDKIKTHARKGTANSDPQSFFHQVLSVSQIGSGLSSMTSPTPGGIVQLNNDPNYSIMGPMIAADVVTCHELWVQDETDYTTILYIEPDVIISPPIIGGKVAKRSNLLIQNSRLQPYRLIQANEVTNWFWGRSELVDLIEPQALLSTWADDVKRLFGLQIDKIIAFMGDTGITDERYAQMRGAGYFGLDPQTKIQDLTPQMPPESIPMLKFCIEIINMIGGFPDIMQGKGESGVRAGTHANTLLKTASPTLRDRSLLVERQCAIAADLTLAIREAKDPEFWWTKADKPLQDVEATKFLLASLPADWRVIVDSHRSSPIFADANEQLIVAAMRMGVVDGFYFIDHSDLPDKEAAKMSLREREEKKAAQMQQMLQQFPEIGEKLAVKQMTGSKR